ncbi:MAG: hypothetical protein CSB15_01490 [Clostridiales bacterium]|nr:MAG: hypothetical protein CSB15_01490 [Clostridiales bacterium]
MFNINKKNIKIIFKISLSLIIFFILTLFLTTLLFVFTTNNNLKNINTVTNKDVAVVFGCGINDNKPTPMLKARIDKAIELYKNKKVKKILLTGYKHGKFYDEVEVMKNYCLKNNIPKSNILEDKNGDNTFLSVKNVVKNFNLNSAILVTQKWHLIRALYICKNIDKNFDVVGVKANNVPYKFAMLHMNLREIPARIKAIYDILRYHK